jgi:hypothetical protein
VISKEVEKRVCRFEKGARASLHADIDHQCYRHIIGDDNANQPSLFSLFHSTTLKSPSDFGVRMSAASSRSARFQFSMEILYIGVILSVGIVTFVFVLHSWDSEKKLGKTRKFRLFFFGISLVSFLFAAGDLILFLLGPHGSQQALFGFSDSYPYLWIGNIPLISFLASAVSGGFFGILERFLELHEKKDL